MAHGLHGACELSSTRPRLGAAQPSHWLFPGGQPGRPVSTARLTQRLGIRPGQARSTALFQLTAEIPAAILARTLGIHTDVAVTWQRLSAGTGSPTPLSQPTDTPSSQAFRQFEYLTSPLHVDTEARDDALTRLDRLLGGDQGTHPSDDDEQDQQDGEQDQ